jgi:hypothetical protein
MPLEETVGQMVASSNRFRPALNQGRHRRA